MSERCSQAFSLGLLIVLSTHVLHLEAGATTRYVSLESINPMPPYDNWSTAATNINDAIDVADPGDVILVTNGLYATGSRLVDSVPNRVAITKPVKVQSLNPGGAWIFGSNALRCVYLAAGATLDGFVVSDGVTANRGGGVFCQSSNSLVLDCTIQWNRVGSLGGGVWSGTYSNCTIAYNSASGDHLGSGARGDSTHPCVLINCTLRGNYYGGAYLCTLTNCVVAQNQNGGAKSCTLVSCTITNNKAFTGGGVSDSILYNCLLSGNSASGQIGGGAYSSTLNNCVLRANSAPDEGGGATFCTLNDCELTGNSAGDGGGASRSTLNRCTLSGNSARSWGGGGAYACALNGCTLVGNTAAVAGGGALICDLKNCLVLSNSAGSYGGGGARYGTLINCTVVGNSAPKGGGVLDAAFNNCIVYYNTAASAANYGGTGLCNYSCLTPIPTNGFGNITNLPLFVAPGSDLQLQTSSPCINAGRTSFITNALDVSGQARVVGGAVDMGAYEFQFPTSMMSYAWAQQYGLPTDGMADEVDTDGDGMKNWQECRCWTDPTNALSVLRMNWALRSATNVTVSWRSVAGVTYSIERSTNFGAPFVTVATNLLGEAGSTVFVDAEAGVPATERYYRVGAE